MRLRKSKGLSIVEILIALAVTSILFTIVARAIGSGGKGLTTLISHSELLEDTRYAGELIHNDLKNSVYVYPPLTQLTLNAATNYYVKNPRTSDNNWVVGEDSIIAMIVAPRTSVATCPTDPDACLTFVAYYAIKRSEVTSANGLSYTGGSLPADPQNPDALMIFEYRKTLDVNSLDADNGPPVSYEAFTSAGRLKDVTARLVADYINPNEGFVVTPNEKGCRGDALFTDTSYFDCPTLADGGTSLPLSYKTTMTAGSFKLRALFEKGRQSFETPELEFSFNPRNLY